MSATCHPTPAAPPAPDVSSFRLIATLTAAGGIAGLLMALLFSWANPRIQAHQAERTHLALAEVLMAPARVTTLYLQDGRLVASLAPGTDSTQLKRVFAGYDARGALIGFGIPGSGPGFADNIGLIFGYDPRTNQVLGMKVLESKETPGLADRIVSDSAFIHGFSRKEAPLEGVKSGEAGDGRHGVDMISGATISSRAVIRIINLRIEEWDPVLDRYLAGGGA